MGGIVNGRVNDGVIKGVGMIGKIINDKAGIVWWLKSSNHLQSVWFEARQTFLYGSNLADKNLLDIFKEGEQFIDWIEPEPLTTLVLLPRRPRDFHR